MLDLGHFSLVAAWLLSLYGLIGGIWGASGFHCRDQAKIVAINKSAANSVYLTAIFCGAALISLALNFLWHDYRYTYVWQHSNNDMDRQYLVSAVWGGMDGSMLLWAGFMSMYSAAVLLRSGPIPASLLNWVVPILSGATNFFLSIVTFLTNPFRFIPGASAAGAILPLDGHGLNPLLQNPSMMIHPPCLYLGFTGFVVPFAFSLAALCSGNLSDAWIAVTRRWTLVAWGFLTTGIILGGNWAYIVLGWGGFWAWDPVENASFLPWLSATAFIHSVMVQQRRGMLKVWNVSLSVLTHALAVFGTFLTRSGIVQSVHAFAQTDIGWIFLAYLGVVLAISVSLIIYRWKELRPENSIESYFSREAAFLFNNLILLAICFSIFWGVMYPVFSEALTGKKSVVGPPFFNRVNGPLFLVLLFFMGVGPLLSWRKSSLRALGQVFLRPFLSGSLLTLVFLYVDFNRIAAAVAFGLCLFVFLTVVGEWRRAIQVRRHFSEESVTQSITALVRRKPQKYGGLFVHLGIVMMAVAITASMVYKLEQDFTLKKGEQFEIGRYRLQLEYFNTVKQQNYTALQTRVHVFDRSSGKSLGVLKPERRIYLRDEETTSEVDIRMTPREDLYLAVGGLDLPAEQDPQKIDLDKIPLSFKVFVNPLQIWLWVGGLMVLCGTLAILAPALKKPVTVLIPEMERAGGRITEEG